MPILTSMPTSISPDPPQVERQLLTAEEFLDWLEPGVFADLIDGETFMHSPVSLRHANLANFLDRLLAAYIEQNRLGQLHRESVAVRLQSRHVFLPDLAFFSNDQLAHFAANHVPLAPVFVAEILSPSTAHLDVGRKFVAYEENGVQEYWILDQSEALQHRFYRRDDEILVEFARSGDWIESSSIPGCKVRREWLNPESAPPVMDCLAAIGR